MQAGMLAGYLAFLVLASAVVPGRRIAGTQLADGTHLRYKCNGFSLLLVVLGVSAGASHMGLIKPTIIADRSGELFAVVNLWTLLLATLLYIGGRQSRSKEESFKPHLSGNPIMDWVIGVQLNPHFLGIDIKWSGIRPSMMGWLLMNLSVAAKQHAQYGYITTSMVLYQLFTGWYILDYFWFEEYMTSTWDIIAEHYGYMLAFGYYVFIPFVFSIQAWWVLHHPQVEVSRLAAFALATLFITGYAVFRGANMQKHAFKKDKKCLIWGRPARTVGGRLLVSGYWGLARHCNYLGDILLALSYSLPCGFSSVVPYAYPIYLVTLLVHRERRDELRCREKYGTLWQEYCSKVKYRIVPYLY
eukprot:jgi/Chlat1/8150/Chrsp76S00609